MQDLWIILSYSIANLPFYMFESMESNNQTIGIHISFQNRNNIILIAKKNKLKNATTIKYWRQKFAKEQIALLFTFDSFDVMSITTKPNRICINWFMVLDQFVSN